jgi:putative acetyltransferase
MLIREEVPSDAAAIAALNRAAFGGGYEADLIARLRADRLVIASLVAQVRAKIVGHILFSMLPTEMDGRTIRAAALAPMAVQPELQNQGIGSKLVEEGLKAARARRIEAVVVLGHPAYYPRFGFSADLARRLAAPFSGEAFMALELVPGALDGSMGSVSYPAAFGLKT